LCNCPWPPLLYWKLPFLPSLESPLFFSLVEIFRDRSSTIQGELFSGVLLLFFSLGLFLDCYPLSCMLIPPSTYPFGSPFFSLFSFPPSIQVQRTWVSLAVFSLPFSLLRCFLSDPPPHETPVLFPISCLFSHRRKLSPPVFGLSGSRRKKSSREAFPGTVPSSRPRVSKTFFRLDFWTEDGLPGKNHPPLPLLFFPLPSGSYQRVEERPPSSPKRPRPFTEREKIPLPRKRAPGRRRNLSPL